MKHLTIDTYFEKVDRTDREPGEYGEVIKGEFELQRSTDMGPDTRTNAQLKKHCKRLGGYLGEPESGKFKQDLGSYLNMRSYQLVYLKEV